jgi:NagD protein
MKNYLIDMDGVLVSGRTIIPGADQFIARLQASGATFLVLTNNPLYTPGDLAHRFKLIGLDIPSERIFTSAMATARFLHSQKANATAFVIGESGLTSPIHEAGYVITDVAPDYVVLGETHSYNLEQITKAIRLVAGGAHFIATNPDPSGPGEGGIVPACGAMAALIERATGVAPFYIGKPQPADDAHGAELPGHPLRGHGDGGRPHGHRHHRRRAGRPGDDPGADRGHARGGCAPLPLPADADRFVGGGD